MYGAKDKRRIVPVKNKSYSESPQDNLLSRNMTMTEMVATTAAGSVFSVGVIGLLATSNSPGDFSLAEDLGDLGLNIVDAAFPLTASDIFSVSIGEGLAGLAGAGASFLLSQSMKRQQTGQKEMPASTDSTFVADGDYFLARAAAFPLLEAAGLPPSLASIASVLFASVPYELVKIGSRRRKQRAQEEKVLDRLLAEQRQKEKKEINTFRVMSMAFGGSKPIVNPDSLVPVGEVQEKLDFVEIFSDITRWLGYSVLTNDFGDRIILVPGVESALFGMTATLSAQIYSDILYSIFGFGGDKRQKEVKQRKMSDWTSLYFSRAVYAATLFGVYDAAQIPAKLILSALVSGAFDGCIGSDDYNLCLESFLVNNPPIATPEAQVRALATTLYNLWEHFLGATPFDF
jgi:hypothetical protein